MKLFSLRNLVFGALVFVGVTGAVNAQNYNDQYRQWQEAQREAQREYNDYLRTRSRSDYRDWQEAQRRAQREYAEYQQSMRYGNRYDNRYDNTRYGTTRSYRIYRNGSYYQTDSRGAELLRQAVNSGYQQGYRQGQVDARYNRRSNYYGNTLYETGTYGYRSYVDRDQYQYYFQQGFQRGYEDGFNNQYRYGYRSNSGLNILGNILNGILNISQH